MNITKFHLKSILFIIFVNFLFLVVVVILFWPAITNISKNIIGGQGDPLHQMWSISWDIHSFITLNIKDVFNANIFFPYPNTLAYSENFFFPSLIGVPIYILTNSYVTTFNVLFLFFYVLMVYSSYLLIRELTQSSIFSFIGSIIYCFNAYHFAHLGHFSLIAGACWIPLIFWSLIKYHNLYRARYLVFCGLFFIFLSLSNAYYMVFTAVSILIFESMIILNRKLFYDRKKILMYFACMGVLILLVSIPIVIVYLPYLELMQTMKFVRSFGEMEVYSTTLRSFITPGGQNLLWNHLIQIKTPIIKSEADIAFVGLFPAIAAIFGLTHLIVSKESRNNTYFYAIGAVGLFAFLASFGPVLSSIGKTTIYGPFALLTYLPGFRSTRVPARFVVFIYLNISVLVSYGFSFLYSRKSKLKFFIMAILLIGVLVESIYYPIPIYKLPNDGRYPDVYRYLTTKPKGPIAEFPIGVFDKNSPLFVAWTDSLYMYFSTSHWYPIMNGYSSFFPPLYLDMTNCTVEMQIVNARRMGIEYLVLHKDMMDKETTIKFNSTAIDSGYVKDYEDEASVLYSNKKANRNKSIIFYSEPQWLVCGNISIPFQYEIQSDDEYLMVESAGNWKYIFKNDIKNLNLMVYVNSLELKLEEEKDNKFYYRLPEGVSTVEYIRITSSTFNPKKLGINDDTRDLGIDIKSIKIE